MLLESLLNEQRAAVRILLSYIEQCVNTKGSVEIMFRLALD